MRRFLLWRRRDITGVSGTGVVAEGVIFGDGATVVRWRGKTRTTTVHENFASVERVHLHEGATVVLWCDSEFDGPRTVLRMREGMPDEPVLDQPYVKLQHGQHSPNGAVDSNGTDLFEGQQCRVTPGAELGDVGEINRIHVSPRGEIMVQVYGVTCSGIADFPIAEVTGLETRKQHWTRTRKLARERGEAADPAV